VNTKKATPPAGEVAICYRRSSVSEIGIGVFVLM